MEDYLQDCRAALQVTGPDLAERKAAWGPGRTKVRDLGSPDGRCGGIAEGDAGELGAKAIAVGGRAGEASLLSVA